MGRRLARLYLSVNLKAGWEGVWGKGREGRQPRLPRRPSPQRNILFGFPSCAWEPDCKQRFAWRHLD